MNIYSAQCQPVVESEALGWDARGSRRPAGSSEFKKAMESMGRGRVVNARWEWVPDKAFSFQKAYQHTKLAKRLRHQTVWRRNPRRNSCLRGVLKLTQLIKSKIQIHLFKQKPGHTGPKKDTDACPTKENNTTMKHTGLYEVANSTRTKGVKSTNSSLCLNTEMLEALTMSVTWQAVPKKQLTIRKDRWRRVSTWYIDDNIGTKIRGQWLVIIVGATNANHYKLDVVHSIA